MLVVVRGSWPDASAVGVGISVRDCRYKIWLAGRRHKMHQQVDWCVISAISVTYMHVIWRNKSHWVRVPSRVCRNNHTMLTLYSHAGSVLQM